ncbi:MAG: DUF2326 domain-containing protein [Bacilli bacterium]|nr:DUF2326 domain-containing protein [Bacilli bacterium]
MLKEIYCDRFKTGGKDGQTREPITFKKGLNIIEGADNGTNSIGKSTFLMIIDFCFGGNDYVKKLLDVKNNVGPHTIWFTFEFDKLYHFARKTDESDFVYVCEEGHKVTDRKIPLDDFTQFLKEKYEINVMDISFRQIVSRFMRIYNRENLNELLPLRAFENETEKNSLMEMVKLYNLYQALKELSRISEEASEKDDTFGKAQEYRFIPKITDTEYKANEKRIEELKAEAEALADRSERGLLDLPAEKAEEITRLKDQITALKRNRSRYYNQLNAFKKDAEFEVSGLKSDFSDLTTYFDNVDLASLQEIEEFHRKISAILKKEVKASINEIWQNINFLNDAIKDLEDQLAEVQQSTNISKVVLKSYATIEKEIETLTKINENHKKKKELHKTAKEKEDELNELIAAQLAKVIAAMNLKMAEINKEFYLNETNAPVLSTPSTKKYLFETPNDSGTGCRYKGMITLDMAVLSTTPLPALAHDSVMFTNMSYQRVERTFKLYSTVEKQIFVAVDRTTNLNDETKKIINGCRRLLLAPNGNELFGWYWGKPKENQNG